jgi:hypothetical protein
MAEGKPRLGLRLRLRLRPAVRTRRVNRRLPGCGAQRSRATPGSSPRIPCTPEVVPELILTILDGNTRASSSRTLAPLQGAISHPTLFRRSRPASTLRLPSFTPPGWGNRRLKDLFLNRNPNLNRNLPFFRSERNEAPPSRCSVLIILPSDPLRAIVPQAALQFGQMR